MERIDSNILYFHETGQWTPNQTTMLRFSNCYRWTLLTHDRRIRLDHLRFGPESPVELFQLQPLNDQTWVSVTPHVCVEDCYTAKLHVHNAALELAWQVKGPEKDESIYYEYW